MPRKIIGYTCGTCLGENFAEGGATVGHFCEGFAEPIYENDMPHPDAPKELAEEIEEIVDHCRYCGLYTKQQSGYDCFEDHKALKDRIEALIARREEAARKVGLCVALHHVSLSKNVNVAFTEINKEIDKCDERLETPDPKRT